MADEEDSGIDKQALWKEILGASIPIPKEALRPPSPPASEGETLYIEPPAPTEAAPSQEIGDMLESVVTPPDVPGGRETTLLGLGSPVRAEGEDETEVLEPSPAGEAPAAIESAPTPFDLPGGDQTILLDPETSAPAAPVEEGAATTENISYPPEAAGSEPTVLAPPAAAPEAPGGDQTILLDPEAAPLAATEGESLYVEPAPLPEGAPAAPAEEGAGTIENISYNPDAAEPEQTVPAEAPGGDQTLLLDPAQYAPVEVEPPPAAEPLPEEAPPPLAVSDVEPAPAMSGPVAAIAPVEEKAARREVALPEPPRPPGLLVARRREFATLVLAVVGISWAVIGYATKDPAHSAFSTLFLGPALYLVARLASRSGSPA